MNETGLDYYQQCNDEDDICEFFGIEEEFCDITTCDTGDLCNKYNGQGSVTYTLTLITAGILYSFL